MPSLGNEYQKRESLKGTVDVTEYKGDFVPLETPLEHYSGKKIALKELFESDKPVILTLNYYSCETLCSVQLNALLSGLKNLDWELGKDFKAVTLSIDPDETIELAKKKRETYLRDLFSAKAGTDDFNEDQKEQLQNLIDGKNWEFLIGGQKEIEKIAQAVGYGFAYDPATKQYLHPAVIMILSPDGMISQYLYGLSYGAQDLKFAMIDLLSNSSAHYYLELPN